MGYLPKEVIDTNSGRVFKSLNQCYKALLQEGELEEMRLAGKLEDNPEEDNFGYSKMRRFYPGRFVREDETLWIRVKTLGLRPLLADDEETIKKMEKINDYIKTKGIFLKK